VTKRQKIILKNCISFIYWTLLHKQTRILRLLHKM